MKEFAKPSPGLLKILSESGETPGYTPPTPAPPVAAPPIPSSATEDTTKKRKLDVTTGDDTRQTKKSTVAAAKGKDWSGKPSEMDRLAQGLQKLQEEDLLQVVRIVMEHKTPEMFVKNDLEGCGPVRVRRLICRGGVQFGFVYPWRSAFTVVVGFHEAESGGVRCDDEEASCGNGWWKGCSLKLHGSCFVYTIP